jgi:hypothetical protein
VAISLSERRTQVALGGAVVAILVVLLLVKVLGGGGNEAAIPPSGAGGGTVAPSTTPSASPSETPSAPPIAIFGGRDPFQPLFSTTTSSPTGTGTPTPTGTGTPTPTGTPSPTPTSTGTGKGSSTTIGGHVVQLDDVFVSTSGVKKAQIEVDGTVYTVTAGQTFDDNFMLVSFVGDPCTNLVFGDQPFQLCTAGGK